MRLLIELTNWSWQTESTFCAWAEDLCIL